MIMSMKQSIVVASLSYMIRQFITISYVSAQLSPVLDTSGQALQRGVDYYINPAITDNGGKITLVRQNGSSPCPRYVAQLALSGPTGFPVTFTPFDEHDEVIGESRDVKIVFSAVTICIQSTQWRVGEEDEETGRRVIVTGQDDSSTGYFRVDKVNGVYNLVWCPSQVCPTCKPRCGSTGILVENGVRLLALDGSVLLVEFVRA